MPRPRILLVEDDPAVRSSIAFALDVEGLDVTSFATAEALLASPETWDSNCVVVDYRLPGMDGLSLLARLRAGGGPRAAIVITSNPSARLRKSVADAGALLVEKPLLTGVLTAAIREATADPAGAPASDV
ncbi:MAG: response regulator [Alphaproteobacteria bacterium]|nr:response regulator [Alphaproteobacteria bacterium]